MKKLLFISLITIVSAIGHAQTVFVVTNVGNSFSPADVNVSPGDIVRFTLPSFHTVLEVSQATWDANGTTPLPGGFSFPSGSGDYTAGTPGIHYFVCTIHVASDGMKGRVIISSPTGVEVNHPKPLEKLYPNPASDFIIYETSGEPAIREIRIVDVIGRTVKILGDPAISKGQLRIDVENLNKGMYFLLVKSDKGTTSKKFLKS